MCSTPRPKRKVTVKAGNASASILSSMSSEMRRDFALRANQASERRIEIKSQKIVQYQQITSTSVTTKVKSKKKAKTIFSWLSCILSASVSDMANEIASKLLRTNT
jgi:hypothetical protein